MVGNPKGNSGFGRVRSPENDAKHAAMQAAALKRQAAEERRRVRRERTLARRTSG